MEKYKVVALLPIKAHSARVKGKNFRSFAGRPLFHWILDSLRSVEEIEKIVINTDAEELLKENGLIADDRIILRKRKSEICGDFVSMNKVLADDVQAIDADTYVMTHTTNPLLTGDTILKALQAYQKCLAIGECDSLFSVNHFQTRFYTAKAEAVNHDPDNLIRTQDLEPWYEENSNLYIFNRQSFGKRNARIGEKPKLFETPKIESVDIDDITGWNMAEMLLLSKLLFIAQSNLPESE